MPQPEATTRKDLIDPQLERAGWKIADSTQVGIEIPVDGTDEPWNGVADYVLYAENGDIHAVIEAKKIGHDARLPEQQTQHYLDHIETHQGYRPLAFMANGTDIYYWNSETEHSRKVHGFFTRDDLKRTHQLRNTAKLFSTTKIKTSIANRPYQIEAIKRVSNAFEQGKRKSLLVMATGTGKTRTSMAIIDLFLKANQARNILFVADRRALTSQALKEGFEKHLPDEPCVRLTGNNIDEVKTNRLFAVTLQTMSNNFRRFSPGFFDLIVFDEVHRSIFNKYAEVLKYFDARMIGLTATPAQFINRDTFITFECYEGVPTFLYTYDDAIEDGYLVDYSLYKAQTLRQVQGLNAAYFSEEDRNAILQRGFDPDDIDFRPKDLEKKVSNSATLREQWKEFFDVCYNDQSGQLPGKTIVFAMTQNHALRLYDAFKEVKPNLIDMARVITYESEYKGNAIEDFKKENLPRIAITVDMLETGVNIPECVNLVFMRPVQSQIKLQQMIGRGTRNDETCEHREWLPDGHKDEFLIIDFWDNDFNREGEEKPAQNLPVTISLFNTRLKLLEHYLDEQDHYQAQYLITALRQQISEIPLDSLFVKEVFHTVVEAWEDDFWEWVTNDKIRLLSMKVAPLLRYVPSISVQALTFTHKVERLKAQIVEGKKTDSTIADIVDDVSRLPKTVRDKHPQATQLARPDRLRNASIDELNTLIEALADAMRQKRKKADTFIELDIADEMAKRGFVVISKTGEEVYVEEYRRRVEERILQLVSEHPTIQAIQVGDTVTDEDLVQLERTLRLELSKGELELNDKNMQVAYGVQVISLLSLLRHLLDMEAIPDYQQIVDRQFDQYIQEHEVSYNPDQIRFLRAVKSVLAQKRNIEYGDFYTAPFTNFGDNAVAKWFTDQEIEEILKFAKELAA